MRSRILAPLVVLVLVIAGAATAAAAGGVFESNDSGLDSPRDLAERGTAATAATGATSPTISLPANTLPENTLTDDNVGGNGDQRSETQTNAAIAPGATQTFAAGDAGSVTLRRDGATLTVLAVNANAGFTSEVERGVGAEVEVQFGDGATRVDFNAELEDGAVRVRVRVSGVVADNPGPTTPTIPDNDDDNVDNSGPGNAHDRVDADHDDNSGPGSGGSDDTGSDDTGADDHGGSGGGGSGGGSGNSGSGH